MNKAGKRKAFVKGCDGDDGRGTILWAFSPSSAKVHYEDKCRYISLSLISEPSEPSDPFSLSGSTFYFFPPSFLLPAPS